MCANSIPVCVCVCLCARRSVRVQAGGWRAAAVPPPAGRTRHRHAELRPEGAADGRSHGNVYTCTKRGILQKNST